jgi:hypothetical protein
MDLFSKRFWAAEEWADQRIASRHVREPLCMDWISAYAAPGPKEPNILELDDAELSRAGLLVMRRQRIPDEGQADPGPAQRRNPAERIRHHAAWLHRGQPGGPAGCR